MGSLRRQLQVGLLGGLLLLCLLLGWGGLRAIHAVAEHFVASRLVHDAETVLAALQVDVGGQPTMRWRRLGLIYDQPLSGHYYQIEFPDGARLASRSLWDAHLAIPQFTPGSSDQWRLTGPDRQELLVWVSGYQKQGRTFTLAVAEDMGPLNREIRRLQWLFVVVMGGIALLLWFALQAFVHRIAGRLGRVRDELENVAEGGLGEIALDTVPLEIQPLVQAFNRLLVLFQQRLERSRKGLGNLSHALKQPISLLQQQLADPALEAQPQLRHAMQQEIERVLQLMEREMRRARLAGAGTPRQGFDTAHELPDLVRLLQKMHAEKGVTIACDSAGVGTLPIDREDMLELLGNLLDNACYWAEQQVSCRLQRERGAVRVTIADDGPGLPPEQLVQLHQAGRLDESRNGHGLGLAICRDMVRLYGGSLRFSIASTLGGLQVEAVLPFQGWQDEPMDDPPGRVSESG